MRAKVVLRNKLVTPACQRNAEKTPFGHRMVCPVCNATFQGGSADERYKEHYKKVHRVR